MNKNTTLNIPGPLQLDFDYQISFDENSITGSHREMIFGLTQEQLSDERLEQELNKCLPRIFNKIKEDKPDFFPNKNININIEINNIKKTFYHNDIHLNFD
ncbi:hypothetical protein FGL54_00360 [Enterobacter cloacae]|nr:hypothetical protein FGL54_00360 [Enterobacter cloacae]HEI9732983.1 hypothetical protein [Enterobacter cloacae]